VNPAEVRAGWALPPVPAPATWTEVAAPAAAAFACAAAAAGAKRLALVLSFPSRELARSPRAVKALRFRNKLTGADIVRYAQAAANDPELANEIEATLYELQRFLTPRVTTQLRSLPILRSRGGALLAPERAYARTARLLACLGEHSAFAIGRHSALHEGCQGRPLRMVVHGLARAPRARLASCSGKVVS